MGLAEYETVLNNTSILNKTRFFGLAPGILIIKGLTEKILQVKY
jgi:hypothetical protein